MHIEFRGKVNNGIIKTILDRLIEMYGEKEFQTKYLSNIVIASPIDKDKLLDGLFAEEEVKEGSEIAGICLHYNSYRVRYKGIDVTVALSNKAASGDFIFELGASTKGFEHYKYTVNLPKDTNEIKAYIPVIIFDKPKFSICHERRYIISPDGDPYEIPSYNFVEEAVKAKINTEVADQK